MRTRIVLILSALLVIASIARAAEGPPPAKVVVAKISERQVAENSVFIGLLYYERVSLISSEVAGLVDSVTIRDGDTVKKGEPLISLDTEILDKEIALSQTRIEQIGLRIKHAEKNFLRLEDLYAKEAASEKAYDDVLFEFQNLILERQAAEKTLEGLLIKKRKSVINAPFDGIVLDKQVDSGEWVQQGKELIRFGSVSDLFVKVPVSETLLKFAPIGEKVSVKINAFDRELTGEIVAVDPVADAKTKNVFLKIRIPAFLSGVENMSADVYVPVSNKKMLKIIPRDALIKFQGKDFVYTVKEGKAAILPVNIVTYLGNEIGADNPYFAVGMQVVVEGNERLRPDQPVEITGEK